MQIEKHISDLLYRYQCVTVPGFGAFLTEIIPAHVTGSASSFFPPKKVVSFNANVKNNDGLLANHVALAVIKINEVVNEWSYLLQNRNRVVVKNIGEISVNNELNWVFEPANTVNYLTDAFGLSSFVSPEITREVLKQQVEALEERAPIIFTPQRKRNYSYLKYAAVFTVMLGAGTFGYKMYYDQQILEQTLIVEKKVQETPALINSVKKLTPLAKKELPKENEAPKEIMSAETKTSPDLSGSTPDKGDAGKKPETETSGSGGTLSDKDITDIKNALTRMAGLLEGTLTVSVLDQPFRPDSRRI